MNHSNPIFNQGLRRLALSVLLGIFASCITLVALDAGQKVFVKRANAPLLADKNRDAEVISKLSWSQEGVVREVDGSWARISAGGKSGWVYAGNLTTEKPADVNKNEMLETSSSDVSANLAARGLDSVAKSYASRKGSVNAANQIEWMEKFNDAIKDAEVDRYLQDNKLGEFSTGATP